MGACSVCIGFLFLYSLLGVCDGSAGDQDQYFKVCVKECTETGCINSMCFQNCRDAIKNDDIHYATKYFEFMRQLLTWKVWDCAGECEYQCMTRQEKERNQRGLLPVQYHGKWPFKRFCGIQEPASAVFSIGNLVMHLLGLVTFLDLVFSKQPQKREGQKSSYYEYTVLWIIYGFLSINSWFWSCIFHSRDVFFTERMDYSSAVAVIGYTLILSVIRTLNLRSATRQMMVAVPITLFVCGHILYLNIYEFDYGLNMKVCLGMGIMQLLVWTVWGWLNQHPARCKLWTVVMCGTLAMLLEIFDFPPIWGVLDAHSLWHALTIPLTCLWWSFIKDDVVCRTNELRGMGGMAMDGGRKMV